MREKWKIAIVAPLFAASVIASTPANARHHYVHRGATHTCSGGNGVVGTVAGGAGGAVLGHAIVGGPVATVAGGVGGAILGNHLDKQNVRHRRGCR
jgi:uncharacterized protein YcfJ